MFFFESKYELGFYQHNINIDKYINYMEYISMAITGLPMNTHHYNPRPP